MMIDEAKQDLARRGQRGITNIGAGVLLWTSFGVLGVMLPPSQERALIYLFGAGLLLPLGLLIEALLKIDMIAKGNPLGLLGGLLGGLQILFIPLMLSTYFVTPQFVPWYLGVLVGGHFLPFMWLYESRTYLFCAVATTTVSAVTGWLLPDNVYVVTPFAVAGVLAITVGLLLREIAADRRADTPVVVQI